MAHNSYTPQEIDFIKYNADVMTDEELAKHLPRHTVISIACKRKRMGIHHTNKKYSYNDLLQAIEHKGYILLSSENDYVNCLSPVKYICPKHKDKGIQTTCLGHLNEGKGCLYCGFERTGESELISEESLRAICKKKGVVYKGRFIKNRCTHIRYICERHKGAGEQEMSYQNMLRPYIRGCKYCSKLYSRIFCSRPVLKIQAELDKRGISYLKEYTFSHCVNQKPLPFDFYLPLYNACIEYDGKHHFMPVSFGIHTKEEAERNFIKTQERDSIKNNYCKTHSIPLLRVSYKQQQFIGDIVSKWLETIVIPAYV